MSLAVSKGPEQTAPDGAVWSGPLLMADLKAACIPKCLIFSWPKDGFCNCQESFLNG